MAFTLCPVRRVPVSCPITHQARPSYRHGTIRARSCMSRRRSGDLSRRQVPAHGLLLSGLLMLASCGDPRDQVHQPLGYGVMPPGETWVAVDSAYQSPGMETVYFDPKTIRREGNRVTLWQLTDYRWMQGNAVFGQFMMGPNRFLSTKTHKEFDCATKRVRILASAEFSQHMGTGVQNAVAVAQGYGQPIEPGSINHALWEVACGKS